MRLDFGGNLKLHVKGEKVTLETDTEKMTFDLKNYDGNVIKLPVAIQAENGLYSLIIAKKPNPKPSDIYVIDLEKSRVIQVFCPPFLPNDLNNLKLTFKAPVKLRKILGNILL